MELERVAIDSLLDHPRNYNEHDAEQIADLEQSLRNDGQFKNIVISTDNYILAGHGLRTAARNIGLPDLDAERVPFAHDHPRALRILVEDNEIAKKARAEQRSLAAILTDLQREQMLPGTGYNDAALDALIAELAVPDFQPVGEDEQGRLDELAPQVVTCPECGHLFDARKAGVEA